MTAFRYADPSGNKATVIDDNASLADAARAAGDLDNSANLDLEAIAFLTVQFDGGPPAAATEVAQLWILPGDAEASEAYPDGGDAGLGTDDDPQDEFYVGSFFTVNPSTTTDEVLAVGPFPLYPHGNRFVLKNVSGQTMDSTWQLDILPYQLEAV